MVQCTDSNCRKPATYGIEYKKPLKCGSHREEGLVNVRNPRCKHPGCKTRPNSNYITETKALYCKPHRLAGMESVVKKKTCLECSKSATFNLRGKTIGLYCGQHKKDKMFNTTLSLCLDCDNYARYGTEDKKPIHCKDHSTENEYQVTRPICVHENCKMGASFSISGRPTHCGVHKTEQMYNTNCKSCAHPSCKELPLYNDDYGMTPLFCVSHKTHAMVMVHGKRCASPGCFGTPSYNYDGLLKLFCTEHKEDGMTNVTGTRCAHEDCTSHPSFNYVGMTAKFCEVHKLEKMENVHSKKCHQDNCNERALCNYEGLPRLYCHRHKHPYMTDVNAKQCIDPDCSEPARYNYPEERNSKYCYVHKLVGMHNVTSNLCISDYCNTQVEKSGKYRGYCRHCFVHLFPDEPVSRNYKTKELEMVRFIKVRFPQFDWLCDKILKGGCSLKRGDMIVDLLTHVIIIECDEDQHVNYSCENKRMMMLSEDVAHRPIIFIRFNPDGYTVNGKKIKSCWGKTKTGIMKVMRPKEWAERLECLAEEVARAIPIIPEKTITQRNLFYDEGSDESVLCQPCE